MNNLEIRFGTLLDILGRPAKSGEFTFVPAMVELAGNGFSIDHQLSESIAESPPLILKRPLIDHFDAAWVRARLPQVFGFTPEIPEVEKSLLDVGFAAVRQGELVGYPFVCTDHYGRTGLMFSEDGPDPSLQNDIAQAYWSLLLADPEDVADFEAAVFHPGTCTWLLHGCEDGAILHGDADENPFLPG